MSLLLYCKTVFFEYNVINNAAIKFSARKTDILRY